MHHVSQSSLGGNPHGNVPQQTGASRDGLVSRAAEVYWLWRQRHRSRANLIGLPDADLIDVREAGLSGAEDPAVLEWAAGQRRVVITHDVNTMPGFAYERVAAGLDMPGVIIVPEQMPIGSAIDDLLIVIECSSEGEYEGRVFYVPL